MIGRFLCRLGFHAWFPRDAYSYAGVRGTCTRCGAIE